MANRVKEDNPYKDALVAIRGYRERLTPGTRYKVIEIDFTADPAKDNPEWLAEQYRLLGDSMVRREVLRDWTVAAGDAFYPEYANYGGRERYEFRARGILRSLPVTRGWDLGHRRPVCTWMQGPVPGSERIYVLRCLPLIDCDSYTLSDLIKFFSGQLPEEEMMPSAQALYLSLRSDGVDKGPWFPPGVEYQDISGPEAFKTTPDAKPDDPRTTYDIFASRGIHLQAPRVLIKDRVKVTRKLLHVRADRRPGIMIADRGCEDIHAMFNGGLAYPKGTPDNPIPKEPRKDGWFDNIHDSLTYPIAELVPAEDREDVTVERSWGGPTGRTPVERVVSGGEEEDLGFYEGRGE